jgi:hypothetical protein
MLAARIVDASVDVLGSSPDRIGPTVVARLFGEVLPRTLGVPDVALREAERVAQQWIEWRAESRELPKKARRNLQETARTALETFSRVCRNPKTSPHFPYVSDLSLEQARGAEIQKVVDRRAFAVPFSGHRGNFGVQLATPIGDLPAGEVHVDELDAGNPVHRALIVIADRPTHGADQMRIDAQTGVIEQLWDDDPPEVWQAAQRLTATGMSRERVLQRLVAVWQRLAPDPPGGRTGARGADPDPDSLDGYVAALRSLGPDPARRR